MKISLAARLWRSSVKEKYKYWFPQMEWLVEWMLKGWEMLLIMICLNLSRHIYTGLVELQEQARLDVASPYCVKKRYAAFDFWLFSVPMELHLFFQFSSHGFELVYYQVLCPSMPHAFNSIFCANSFSDFNHSTLSFLCHKEWMKP